MNYPKVSNWGVPRLLATPLGIIRQVRGSCPVYWEQPSANSSVVMTRGTQLTALAFRRHQDGHGGAGQGAGGAEDGWLW